MKQDIHPKYFPNAKISCACGNSFSIGSTKEDMKVEICYNCHPFYTGKENLIDAAGKVEKFQARRTKAAATPKKTPKIKKSRESKATKLIRKLN